MDNFVFTWIICDEVYAVVQESSEASTFVSRQVASSRLFFLDDGGDEDFAVVFGGYENCTADYRIDRQDLPWFCLEFVSRGVGSLRLNGRQEALRAGSFFLYGPGIEHQIESSAEIPLGKYFVGFKGRRAAEFLEQYEIGPGFSSLCPKNEPIRLAFDSLLVRGLRKTHLAHPLCAVILRQILLMCRDDASEVESPDSLAFATFARVRDYITANFLRRTLSSNISKVGSHEGAELLDGQLVAGRAHEPYP
jgi:hypothetical protein